MTILTTRTTPAVSPIGSGEDVSGIILALAQPGISMIRVPISMRAGRHTGMELLTAHSPGCLSTMADPIGTVQFEPNRSTNAVGVAVSTIFGFLVAVLEFVFVFLASALTELHGLRAGSGGRPPRRRSRLPVFDRSSDSVARSQ